jgi:hypothetical protein
MIFKLSEAETIPLPSMNQAMNFFVQRHVITVMHAITHRSASHAAEWPP